MLRFWAAGWPLTEGEMQASAIIDVEPEAAVDSDAQWVEANLRRDAEGRIYADLANCLRIIERHPDFKGRFRFNEVLVKVLDKGTVMIEWRLGEFVSQMQERFIPEIPYEIASRALVVAANRAGNK